jgi:hypothetical protein
MKTKEFQRRAVRHGEVMIVPIDKLPAGLEEVERGAEIIIGHSETGHHHVAVAEAGDLTLFRSKGTDLNLYLQVMSKTKVEHRKTFDQHEAKELEPGYYHINTKMAYDYFLKRAVRVVD